MTRTHSIPMTHLQATSLPNSPGILTCVGCYVSCLTHVWLPGGLRVLTTRVLFLHCCLLIMTL